LYRRQVLPLFLRFSLCCDSKGSSLIPASLLMGSVRARVLLRLLGALRRGQDQLHRAPHQVPGTQLQVSLGAVCVSLRVSTGICACVCVCACVQDSAFRIGSRHLSLSPSTQGSCFTRMTSSVSFLHQPSSDTARYCRCTLSQIALLSLFCLLSCLFSSPTGRLQAAPIGVCAGPKSDARVPQRHAPLPELLRAHSP
jgi:hypothetical protein